MANNPKKVKDPTEVALSAIQEALNISDTTADTQPKFARQRTRRLRPVRRPRRPIPICLSTRGAKRRAAGVRSDRGAAQPPVAPPMTIAKPSDRFCRRSRRAALPAASIRSPPLFGGVWMVGCGAADRQLPALAAGGDRTERRRAGAGRPCRVVLCAGAVVLFPREPGLARPGNAHDRAVDGAGRDPLLRARGRGRRLDGDRRPGDPPRSRRDGRRRRARDRARRRTGNARRQRSRGARARLQRQRSAHPRAAAGHRPSARQSGRPGRAGSQRHFRRADRPAPRYRADLGRDRLARRRGRQKHHRRAGRARRSTSPARSAMPATT